MIPYGRQDITDEDISAVVNVLRSDWLTQGPNIPVFEKLVANDVGAKHALATSSATTALHLACLSLGIGVGDLVWTSPITFVASSNCALYCGASVDFVDIDPLTRNICIAELGRKLELAKKKNKLPKAVVVVHFAGAPAEMKSIKELSEIYGFSIIEDASHAIGAKYQGQKVGGSQYSDCTVYSFHPVKIITTGEGGMLLTNSDKINRMSSELRSHGITRDVSQFENGEDGGWYYEQQSLGSNYRITDIQAALGSSQYKRVEQYVEQRNSLANKYHSLLADLPLQLPTVAKGDLSAWHLYTICLNEPKDRRRVFDTMKSSGIGVNVHYIPVHTQPYYKKMGFKESDFPNAMKYYNSTITIPIFPTMTEEMQSEVVRSLRSALR